MLIQIDNWSLLIRTQDAELTEILKNYFGKSICCDDAVILTHLARHYQPTLSLYPTEPERLQHFYNLPWQDWQREPGKQGRKEAIYDISPIERLVYKIRSGLILWQHPIQLRAFGPLHHYPNQIINFILTQYLNWRLHQGGQLGHCAALKYQGRGIAIAGFSGGGKSTLMLHLLNEGDAFISNDRIVIHNDDQQIKCYGIPKQPRVNPGTLLHNPRLSGILKHPEYYQTLDDASLRQLEEKYDVMIADHFPNQPYQSEVSLDLLIILDWQVNTAQATQLDVLDLAAQPNYLAAVMKSAGPFYQAPNGKTPDTPSTLNPEDYLALLKDVTILRLTGRIDFKAAKACIDQFLQHSS